MVLSVKTNELLKIIIHKSNHRRTGPTSFMFVCLFVLLLGGGGAEVLCPNIFSGAPALENSLSGGGGGGGGGTRALVTVHKNGPL